MEVVGSRGLWADPPRNYLKATPFNSATKVTNANLYTTNALEKHEIVGILEIKEKMLCRAGSTYYI